MLDGAIGDKRRGMLGVHDMFDLVDQDLKI